MFLKASAKRKTFCFNLFPHEFSSALKFKWTQKIFIFIENGFDSNQKVPIQQKKYDNHQKTLIIIKILEEQI